MIVDIDGETVNLIFLILAILPSLIGIVAGYFKGGNSGKICVALCGTSCIVGIFALPLVLCFGTLTAEFPLRNALGAYATSMDLMSSIFVTVSSFVYLAVIIHMIGSKRLRQGKYCALICALYIAVFLCIISDTIILLLMSWETVSALTFLLARRSVDLPRWRFAAITHMGGLILLAVFGYLWMVSGSVYLSDWKNLCDIMSPLESSVCIILLFIGFGTKLGLLPFHAWMPDLYSVAPTHTVSLLTTVCSNVAILILFKAVFVFIGIHDSMVYVAVIICGLSAVTALWGAMESMVQWDPRRILAYSSMENMALVCMFLGWGLILDGAACALSLLAALLHTLNHSIFKSLMLLSVDSVEDAVGSEDIHSMGGLALVMPGLSVVALVAVMSLAAIPPMNGFVSEWLMLQTLIDLDMIGGFKVIIPLFIAMMGVCGMIVATSYARLYGSIFLGRPRSEGAARPKSIKKICIIPLFALSGLCISMGVFGKLVISYISDGLTKLTGLPDHSTALNDNFDPLYLAIMLFGACIIIIVIFHIFKKKTVRTETWGCGEDLDENMQYTSDGFSQPLVKVFHPFYQDVSSVRNSKYTMMFVEPFVKYIYRPVGFIINGISQQVTRIQTGNIQSYLLYILIVVVVVLLGVRTF